MSIRKARVLFISEMLALVLLISGLGLGLAVWLRSWHGDFVGEAEKSGTLTDPTLQDMLSRLDGRATTITIAIAVAAAIALTLGVRELTRVRKTAGRRIQAAAGRLATSSSELLAIASQVSSSSAQTAAATNQTTATVEEVKQTAALAQDKAVEAAELTDDVLESSKIAENMAYANSETFDQTRSAMDVIAEAMSRLSEEAEAVSDIMERVNDLAEQSNLLSVNASIEAVKAGEAGRGFTVVAQEVKSLAGQSKQAVTRVGGVLGDIRKAIKVVTEAVEQGRKIAVSGSDQIHQSVDSIRNRVAKAGKAAESVMQIAATGRQQLAGMEQIEQAIMSIDESGKQALAASKQVQEEVERLQAVAVDLQDMVNSGNTKARAS